MKGKIPVISRLLKLPGGHLLELLDRVCIPDMPPATRHVRAMPRVVKMVCGLGWNTWRAIPQHGMLGSSLPVRGERIGKE